MPSENTLLLSEFETLARQRGLIGYVKTQAKLWVRYPINCWLCIFFLPFCHFKLSRQNLFLTFDIFENGQFTTTAFVTLWMSLSYKLFKRHYNVSNKSFIVPDPSEINPCVCCALLSFADHFSTHPPSININHKIQETRILPGSHVSP